MKWKPYIWLQLLKSVTENHYQKGVLLQWKQAYILQNPEVGTLRLPAMKLDSYLFSTVPKVSVLRGQKPFHRWPQKWTGRSHVNDWISLGWLSSYNLAQLRDNQRLTPLSFVLPLPGHRSRKLVLDSPLSSSYSFHSIGDCCLPNSSVFSPHSPSPCRKDLQ